MALAIIILSVYIITISLAGLVCEFFEEKEVTQMTNTLFEIKRAAWRADMEYAAMALEWYVNTGRSTWRFDAALKRANPDKLVRFIGDDGNYHSAVKKAKKYLQRYCGLEKEEV